MIEQLLKYKEYLINIKRSLVYFNYLRSFFKYLEEQNIHFESITKDQLANYFKVKNYKSNSINKVISSCRDYCRYLEIDKHACFEIKLLEVEQKTIEYLTLQEIEKAIKYIASYNFRLNINKIELILYFLFFTGIRKSELINLHRKSINLETCLVKIYENKTKKEKIIPFPEKLKEKIIIYFKSESEKENAFNITKRQINYLFREVISKHLEKKVKPHLTRHGGARYMMEKGVSPTAVQKILGHTSLNTTLRYIEADQKMIEDMYRKKIG